MRKLSAKPSRKCLPFTIALYVILYGITPKHGGSKQSIMTMEHSIHNISTLDRPGQLSQGFGERTMHGHDIEKAR